jgi:DNA polymerase-3 subunit alpha
MSFVPLHIHSQYSILDSLVPIKSLVKKAKEYELNAIALTDSGNMFGHVDFYKACRHESIKPILGCYIHLCVNSRLDKKKEKQKTSFPIILLVKNKEGYRNLCKLSSIGYLEGFYYRPRIDKEVLEKYSEGLICLAGINSYIANLMYEGLGERAVFEIAWYQNLFGDDFYFELQRLGVEKDHEEPWAHQKMKSYFEREKKVIGDMLSFASQLNIKCVATNEVHYLEKEDWKGHEVLLNIQSGEPCEIYQKSSSGVSNFKIPNPKRRIYPSFEFYFKSFFEMQELFKDFPKALENTLEVADKCVFEFNFKTKHYPVFIPPDLKDKKITKKERLERVAEHLYELCFKNIEKRYTKNVLNKIKKKYPDQDPLDVVKKRLEYEFGILSSKGLCDYILIVHDFVSWAKNRKIPVGPGRGSVAGSIMAYLIGITNIEPLCFDLVFERFINPERISYPDIDVDICMDRRQEVIDYTINKYGKDKVAQIITFGTMKAKMAIRDVGRMLSVPLSKVDKIAKLVPEELNITLEKALEMDPELRAMYHSDKDTKMIIDIGKKVEGSIRNTSIHAAGIIISEDPITDYVPVCLSKDVDMLITQFSMKPVESLGMLKIDFLGLKTLTSIQKAVDQIEKKKSEEIKWFELSLDDKNTYKLLNRGSTLGVFQLESLGMQELVKKLRIDKFEEIMAVGALYRPGPMAMIPSFINRKHKKEKIEIDHPLMKSILEETYGVMVYQEQVMQVASKLAGYSLGEGDFLRKAIGKKDRKEMEKQREKFFQGCLKNGVEESTALLIFDKIEKFASYGFNKSHAAAYAYLSYVTAFLKANFPKYWMASLLTCDRDDLTKVAKFIRECKAMGIDVLPPDVNEAGSEFRATKEGVRFAMSGIKGIGLGVVEAIEEERKKGEYGSLFDFIKRVDKKRVGKKNIEVLIGAGAFDFTKEDRNLLKSKVSKMYDRAIKDEKEREKGVLNFLSVIDEREEPFFEGGEKVEKLSRFEVLQEEQKFLGLYLTGHPISDYKHILKRLSCVPLKDLEKKEDMSLCRCAFIIDSVRVKIASKTQRKFAILEISDELERFELPIWPELYEKRIDLISENQLIYSILQVEKRENRVKLQCHLLEDLTKIDEKMLKDYDEFYDQTKIQLRSQNFRKRENVVRERVLVYVDADVVRFSSVLKLKEIFLENPGKSFLELHFFSRKRFVGRVLVNSSLKVDGREKFCDRVKGILGVNEIRIQR